MDAAFAKEKLKSCYVDIIALDKEERPIQHIEGKVISGNISIDGGSSVRRTGNLSMITLGDNNIEDIESLLSLNKKIKLVERITTPTGKEQITQLGIFVITQPSIQHSYSGTIINIAFKDKMCLLNGECGGGLPTSITFHEYDQLNSDGTHTHIQQRIYDIIQTLVINFGGEAASRVFIDNVPLVIKQLSRYVGNKTLYFNTVNYQYSINTSDFKDVSPKHWMVFDYNEDCGYKYTDFVYPGELISSIGDNVCSVLDKIKSALGNYEYFYDTDGNFHFQEIKNYLNKSYYSLVARRKYTDENGNIQLFETNELSILDDVTWESEYFPIGSSVYTFGEGDELVSSYSYSPSYTNIKNDFHVWGENEDVNVIHYHLAIKAKPTEMTTFYVNFLKDEQGEYTGKLELLNKKEGGEPYVPADWRAQLYLTGLEKKKKGTDIRPDIYEQELLDWFDTIYNFKEKQFKNNPANLKYWLDFIEPSSSELLSQICVENIGIRTYSYQNSKIKRMFMGELPNAVILDNSSDTYFNDLQECINKGENPAAVSHAIFENIALGTNGYTAQDNMRELIYQQTSYISSISISCVPIYDLEPNIRITVKDKESNIYGDYIIKTISLPLNGQGQMTISATKALERV